MKTFVDHIQLNVSSAERSLPFYRRFFTYMGYRMMSDKADHVAASNGTTDFWVVQTDDRHLGRGYHRKATGINHVCFGVLSKDEVDRFADEFLANEGIVPMYDSPKEFPEYTKGYYAVFFEDPDRIKIEVAYIPKEG